MASKPIRFSRHAELKFEILASHQLHITKGMVEQTLRNPEAMFSGYKARKVAQGTLDQRRVVRVVYEELADEIVIITFYPARKGRHD